MTKDVSDALSSYRARLGQGGIFEMSSRPTFERDRLVSAFWKDVPEVSEILCSTEDGLAMQLCSPEQLPLLDCVPANATLVRFAPAAARGDHPARDGVTWVRSHRATGLVRLVRLRPGTVRFEASARGVRESAPA